MMTPVPHDKLINGREYLADFRFRANGLSKAPDGFYHYRKVVMYHNDEDGISLSEEICGSIENVPFDENTLFYDIGDA